MSKATPGTLLVTFNKTVGCNKLKDVEPSTQLFTVNNKKEIVIDQSIANMLGFSIDEILGNPDIPYIIDLEMSSGSIVILNFIGNAGALDSPITKKINLSPEKRKINLKTDFLTNTNLLPPKGNNPNIQLQQNYIYKLIEIQIKKSNIENFDILKKMEFDRSDQPGNYHVYIILLVLFILLIYFIYKN